MFFQTKFRKRILKNRLIGNGVDLWVLQKHVVHGASPAVMSWSRLLGVLQSEMPFGDERPRRRKWWAIKSGQNDINKHSAVSAKSVWQASCALPCTTLGNDVNPYSIEPTCNSELIRASSSDFQFWQRGQWPDGSVLLYTSALGEFVLLCKFGTLHDEIIRDQLIEKTSSTQVRKKLLLESDDFTKPSMMEFEHT